MNRAERIIATALIVVAAALRLYAFTRQDVQVFSDTSAFQSVAIQPVLSEAFWAGMRPPAIPLVHKLLGSQPVVIAWAQVLLGLVAWSALALAVFATIAHRWMRHLALAAILLIGTSSVVAQWDKVILAESLTLSFMALCFAGGLLAIDRGHWLAFAGMAVSGTFWGLSRASEVIPIAVFVVIALVLVVTKNARPRWLLIPILGGAVIAANQFGNVRGLRWEFPMLNVLMQRVLPEADRVAYYQEAGMPVTPDLMRFAGKWASHENSAIRKEPALAPFRAWFRERAGSTYLRLCASRPGFCFGGPWSERESLVSPWLLIYRPAGFTPIWPSALDDRMWHGSLRVLAWGVVAACSLAVICLIMRRSAPVMILPLGCLVAVPLSALAIWHADAMEIPRHSAGVAVQLRLAVVLLVLYSLDRLLARRVAAASRSPKRVARPSVA